MSSEVQANATNSFTGHQAQSIVLKYYGLITYSVHRYLKDANVGFSRSSDAYIIVMRQLVTPTAASFNGEVVH